jgi:hypothetical protein
MSGARFAVLEDDTVLCAGVCARAQGESVSGTGASIVHAWLADLVGETCHGCGARDDRETDR